MNGGVAVTGTGVISPLGRSAAEVLWRIDRGDRAARPPSRFDAGPFACPVCAEIPDFRAEQHVPDPKTIRMMNRDAQLAVGAARLAMADAGIVVGEDYAPEEIALYGSTGLAGIGLDEVSGLIRRAAGDDGSFDPRRFGAQALRRVRPVLSFKILSNMPLCFVSIFERIQGPNAAYSPWEGQGAQAIAAGIRAVRRGDVPCALVGGCDAKAHELAFISLEQQGVFDSWRRDGHGTVPAEGAAFLVLEEESSAARRGAALRARLVDHRLATIAGDPSELRAAVVSELACHAPAVVISARDNGTACPEDGEFDGSSVRPEIVLSPKLHVGNLFAAAAALQVILATEAAGRGAAGRRVLANCFGHGSQQAAFVLEGV